MADKVAAQEQVSVGNAGTLSPRLLFSTVVIAFGSLLFGFETAVISGATIWLTKTFLLTDTTLGLAVSSSLVGCIVGAALVAGPAERWGRKAVLFAVSGLYIATALGCALAVDLPMFALARFIGGIAVGAASVVAPLYIAELSPATWRGRLVTITQFNVVTGILLAYLSNYLIGRLELGDAEARWMFGVMAAPATLYLFLLGPTPQSPRWLVRKGKIEEAKAVFRRCGVDGTSLGEEIDRVHRSFEASRESRNEKLFGHKHRFAIGLAVAIAMFNQLSGINAVLYYLPSIFHLAGAGKTSALLQSVIVGTFLLLFTLAAILTIDRIGRRRLLLIGCCGCIASLGVLSWLFFTATAGWLMLAALCLLVASHAFGNGAVIWVFIAEIFPNSVRASGQALGTFVHWVMAALVAWTFPILASLSPTVTFTVYAMCMVAQLIWILLLVPETKGIALESVGKNEICHPPARPCEKPNEASPR